MKKILKHINLTPFTIINTLAIMLVIRNVNMACYWFAYQPSLPDSAKKFIKD